jgi:16S rRNA processing protein RimM
MGFMPVGVVARAFGIRGEVRVKPYNPGSDWFGRAGGAWLRRDAGSEPVFHKIKRCKPHKGFFLLTLEGVMDRNEAEAIRGMEVLADEAELDPLSPGEYYWSQLIGLEVETGDGAPLGKVTGMIETAPELDGNDIFVVTGEKSEMMIPATEQAVLAIDLSQKKMVVDPVFAVVPE